MPGPITYAAITLLARDRIGQIKRALSAKKAAGFTNELDLHILHLATEAERMMNDTQPVIEPPVRLYGPPLTENVSRFTLLGAIGPDLPRYGAYFATGQRWLVNTLHKGTPDEHRELVLTNSTNLVFDFWKRVGPLIDADISDQPKRDAAKQQMQAYALGHLCHIAADVLTHPYFESIEARMVNAPAVTRRMTRDDVAGAFDVRVSDQFFGRSTDTHTKQWADWFPTSGDVPAAFAKAMAASIEAMYTARAKGLPAFEEAFAKIDPAPPPLSADLIDESISYFRTIIEIERVWTYCDWLGATAAMFIPIAFAPLGALLLPQGKNLSKDLPDGPLADQRKYESIVYPLAISSLGPLVTMIIVSASGRSLRAEGVIGWVEAGVSLVASIGFFATLGGAGAARWTLLFAIPLALAAFQTIFAMVRGTEENSRRLLWLGPLVQIVLALIFMLLYHVWLHVGVEEIENDTGDRDVARILSDVVGWFVIVMALWFFNAWIWKRFISGSVPEDQNDFSAGEPRQFLRLYDDVSLIHDLGKPFDSERLTDLAYPPARRPIMKLWWVGVGGSTAKVRVDHDRVDRLVFSFPGSGLPDRSVYAPLAPITIERWATLVASAVTRDGAIGALHTKPARDDEKGIELAAGALFSDTGDEKTSQADYDAAVLVPADIGATEETAFTLFHTPRPRLSERMGQSGVAPDGNRPVLLVSNAGMVVQLVPGTNPRLYRVTNATDGTVPRLRNVFVPGDVIEITTPAAQRIVEQVVNDTDIILSSPFPAIAGAGSVFKRAPNDRTRRAPGLSPVSIPGVALGIGPNDIQGNNLGVGFGITFMVGDVIELAPPTQAAQPIPAAARVVPERRVVVAVKDRTLVGPAPGVATNLLELDQPATPFTGSILITRLSDAEIGGFPMVADASDVFGDGGSAMNDAADLAALLCLGAASRLGVDDALVTPKGAKKPVHRVSQVFRNWNLDRRRVNEWKMMVSGGAVSERRGDYRAAEEAAPVATSDVGETFSDAFIDRRKSAEATVLEHGWLGVFRSWVDMASRARTDTTAAEVFRPGQPPNRDLSRAMAYLIDAVEGVTP